MSGKLSAARTAPAPKPTKSATLVAAASGFNLNEWCICIVSLLVLLDLGNGFQPAACLSCASADQTFRQIPPRYAC
jgi:hypothetical protein